MFRWPVLVCGASTGSTNGSHADGSREKSKEEIADSRNCKYMNRQITNAL